ncbi:hypothetical protein BDB01DRAFT_808026 [Pilobolus umbonatus]|nr:hypothetical protein BDB01DRAFT_808026 [Pilobolus umbonatus]
MSISNTDTYIPNNPLNFNPDLFLHNNNRITLLNTSTTDIPDQSLSLLLSLDSLPSLDGVNKEKQDTSKLSVEENEKKKRNMAASARFRMRKKLKGEEMQKNMKEMEKKTQTLETRVNELQQEIEWLKGLLIQKPTLDA